MHSTASAWAPAMLVVVAVALPGTAFAQAKTAAQLLEEFNQRQRELANLNPAQPGGEQAGGAQPGQIKGSWTANCRLPQYPDRVFPAAGTFELSVQPNGTVSGRYFYESGSFTVSGQRQASGTANGTAVPSEGTGAITWQGTMPLAGGRMSGSGSLVFRAADRTCPGQWNSG